MYDARIDDLINEGGGKVVLRENLVEFYEVDVL
jgi:hypothetical protein